jgi:hypothetical protein
MRIERKACLTPRGVRTSMTTWCLPLRWRFGAGERLRPRVKVNSDWRFNGQKMNTDQRDEQSVNVAQ